MAICPTGSEVFFGVERHLLVERGVRAISDVRDADRVAVGLRFRDQVEANDGRGAGPIVDHHLLSQYLRQARREDAQQHVGRSTRCWYGTMMRIGLAGYVCAGADAVHIAADAASAMAAARVAVFMKSPPWFWLLKGRRSSSLRC